MSQKKLYILYVTSFLVGFAMFVNFIAATANILSNFSPVYVIYATSLGSILYSIAVIFLNARKAKFSKFFSIFLYIYSIVQIGSLLAGSYHFEQAIICFALVTFSSLFISWAYEELILRNFNPAIAKDMLGSFDDGSTLAGLIATILLLYNWIPGTLNIIFITTAIIYTLVGLIFTFTFSTNKYIEIDYDHLSKIQTHKTKSKHFTWFLILSGVIAGLFSINTLFADYLIALVVKDNFITIDAITRITTLLYFINILIKFILDKIIDEYDHKVHFSPYKIMLALLAFFATTSALSLYLELFYIYLFVGVSILLTTNSIFWRNQSNIAAYFSIAERIRVKAASIFVFYLVTSLLMIKVTSHLQELPYDSNVQIIHLCFIFFSLLTIPFLYFLNKTLTHVLYDRAHSISNQTTILAIYGLSYLKPKSFLNSMLKMLKNDDRIYVKKAIINSLKHWPRLSKDTTLNILESFESNHIEIQLAVLDFIEHQKTITCLSYLIEVIFNKHQAHSIAVRLKADEVLAKIYGNKAIPFLIDGLKNEDNRIVANSIEVIAEFEDKLTVDFFKEFKNSDTPRIKANSLMALSRFRETKSLYIKGISIMLKSHDPNLISSALYAIGKNRDDSFAVIISKLDSSKTLNNAMILRNLAWYYVNLNSIKGYELFANLFLTPYEKGKALDFLHFFGQFSQNIRFNLIEYFIKLHQGDIDKINNLKEILKNSHLDFYEELEFVVALGG